MDFEEAFAQLVHKLNSHEQKSQARYEHLCEKLDADPHTHTEHSIMDNNAGLAAVIAALGQRNEGDSNLGPVMAMMGNRHDGFGGGGMLGLIGGLVLGSLFRGRGGIFGGEGDNGCANGITPGQAAFDQTILNGITGLTAAVPTTGLQTQNAIQAAIGQLALADQQGFSGVKDAVQALALFQSNQLNNINQNVSSQGCETREVVQAGTAQVLSAIKDGTIANLQAELFEARNEGRARATEFNLTQTVTQGQQQGQLQAQFGGMADLLRQVVGELQVARATNANLIIGNTGATTTGPQTANPINVRS